MFWFFKVTTFAIVPLDRSTLNFPRTSAQATCDHCRDWWKTLASH